MVKIVGAMLLLALLVPASPATRVAGPTARWWTCADVPRFRLAALRNPAGFERGSGPLARAVRRHGGTGWRFLSRSGRRAAVIRGRRPGYRLMRLTRTNGRWKWAGSGTCRPRARRAPGLAAVPWKPQRPPAAPDTRVPLLVREQSCASGRDATGRVLAPWVHYGRDEVTVTYHVRPVEGFATCQANPVTRVLLELEEPLGDRRLVDGGVPPRTRM